MLHHLTIWHKSAKTEVSLPTLVKIFFLKSILDLQLDVLVVITKEYNVMENMMRNVIFVPSLFDLESFLTYSFSRWKWPSNQRSNFVENNFALSLSQIYDDLHNLKVGKKTSFQNEGVQLLPEGDEKCKTVCRKKYFGNTVFYGKLKL